MNLAELQKTLLAAARAREPDEHVPYAFERRVMARLAISPALDPIAIWNRILWRAVTPCVAVMLLLGVWTFLSLREDNSGETLAADLENSLYLPFDNQTDIQ
jgi:transposase